MFSWRASRAFTRKFVEGAAGILIARLSHAIRGGKLDESPCDLGGYLARWQPEKWVQVALVIKAEYLIWDALSPVVANDLYGVFHGVALRQRV